MSDERFITIRVDKHTGTILRIALPLGEHVEVPAMGSQKYVAGQSMQHQKGMLEIENLLAYAFDVWCNTLHYGVAWLIQHPWASNLHPNTMRAALLALFSAACLGSS